MGFAVFGQLLGVGEGGAAHLTDEGFAFDMVAPGSY